MPIFDTESKDFIVAMLWFKIISVTTMKTFLNNNIEGLGETHLFHDSFEPKTTKTDFES